MLRFTNANTAPRAADKEECPSALAIKLKEAIERAKQRQAEEAES